MHGFFFFIPIDSVPSKRKKMLSKKPILRYYVIKSLSFRLYEDKNCRAASEKGVSLF
jgi:hypothetical protein